MQRRDSTTEWVCVCGLYSQCNVMTINILYCGKISCHWVTNIPDTKSKPSESRHTHKTTSHYNTTHTHKCTCTYRQHELSYNKSVNSLSAVTQLIRVLEWLTCSNGKPCSDNILIIHKTITCTLLVRSWFCKSKSEVIYIILVVI